MDSQAGQLLLDVGLVAVLVVVGIRFWRRRRATAPASTAAEAPVRQEISSRQEAEQAASAHLTGIGFDGVTAAEDEDGPIDLIGDVVAAQVAWRARPIGVDAVEALQAAAGARRSVLYSYAGCTRPALKRAEEMGLALFRLKVDGSAQAENETARLIEGAST